MAGESSERSGARGTYRAQPSPDRSGGARVVLPAGTVHAEISSPDLRAVDVVADAALRSLDLSGCAPGLFVTLDGTRSIERIAVPRDGRGAVLYMVVEGFDPPIRVEGAVAMVDIGLSSPGEKVVGMRLDAGNDPPFPGAWLGTGSARPPPDLGALFVVGGRVGQGWLEEARALRSLVAHGVRFEGEVRTACELQSVYVTHGDLASLAFPSAGWVRFDLCPAIARVSGQMGRLVLRGGARVRELVVDGHAVEVDLAGVECASLRVPSVGRLLLSGEHKVKRVRTLAVSGLVMEVAGGRAPRVTGSRAVSVRPLTPADIEREFLHGTEAGRAGMVAWARQCRKAGEYWLALQVLSSAIDTGLSGAVAWRDRCALMPGRGSKLAWRWTFPDDLAIRGWTADVRLWLRCVAAEVPEAIEYAAVLASSHEPAHLAALLAVAAADDVSEGERDILLEIAARSLSDGASRGRRLDVVNKASTGRDVLVGIKATDLDWMQLALRALLELAHDPRAPQLAAAYAGWIAHRAPSMEGVRVLGGLSVHGCNEAHEHLYRLREELDTREELPPKARAELSRAITHQLLQPPTPPFWGARAAQAEAAQ